MKSAWISCLLLVTGCTLVSQSRIDRVLDADQDGWTVDIDCDNADPEHGAAEFTDDTVDNNCDGHALIDLRNWPTDDSQCWLGSAGNPLDPVLLTESGFIDPADSTSTPATRVAIPPDVDGDGIPERLYAQGGTIVWAPSAGAMASFDVEGEVGTTLAWGGMTEGCPTALIAGVHDVQPSWIAVRRIELCTGSVMAEWSYSAIDRRYEDLHILDIGTDFWPEVLFAQPFRDAPSISIQYREQPNRDELHDQFDVRIRGVSPPFAERVAAGDMDGDNREELLFSAPDGAWLLTGTTRPGPSDTVQEIRIDERGIFLPTGPIQGLAFRDLDRNGTREALVAVSTETGALIHAFDIDGAEVALLAAPPGPCETTTLDDAVLISEGTAFFLP